MEGLYFRTSLLPLCYCFLFLLMKQIHSELSENSTATNNSFFLTMDIIRNEIPDNQEDFSSKYCVCGEETSQISPRVIGGERVNMSRKHPWVVGLTLKTGLVKHRFICAGSIISRKYILTAAHCLTEMIPPNYNMSSVEITVGKKKLPIKLRSLKGSKYMVHPDFRKGYINDIALIKLKKPLKFSSRVRPVCLQKENSSIEADSVVTTGWGHIKVRAVVPRTRVFHILQEFLSEPPKPTKTLREVSVPVVPHHICKQNFKGFHHITDSMLCAGAKSKGACHGDSGGALITNYEGRQYAVGVVSFGVGCGLERFPGIYTRISHYLEWIANNTRDAPPCRPE